MGSDPFTVPQKWGGSREAGSQGAGGRRVAGRGASDGGESSAHLSDIFRNDFADDPTAVKLQPLSKPVVEPAEGTPVVSKKGSEPVVESTSGVLSGVEGSDEVYVKPRKPVVERERPVKQPVERPVNPVMVKEVRERSEGSEDAHVGVSDVARGGSDRVRGVARGGQLMQVPDKGGDVVMSWPSYGVEEADYVPDDEVDFSDLHGVNRDLVRAKARCFRVSQHLKQAQRDVVEAKTRYKRALRRELIQISGGTAEVRKAAAELRCEDEELVLEIAEQVVEEWKKRSLDCRDDLKALENISHNVRAQMNTFEK